MITEYLNALNTTNKTILIMFLILIVFTFAINKYVSERINNSLSRLNKINANTLHLVAFFFIIGLGILVRVYQFGAVPAGVNQDGAMAAVDANALANYGTDRFGMWLPAHFTAWGYGQMSVLLSYLMVPFIKLFGFSVFTIRLPLLVVSIVAIYVSYLVGTKLINKNFGLVFMALVAISPWQIMQSRWAIDCNLLPHFILFGIYFLMIGLDKKRYMYISMIFFGLSMYAYGVALYTVPVMLGIAFVILLIRKQVKWLQAIYSTLIYLVVSAPFLMVMAINFLKLKTIYTPFFTLPYFQNSVRSNDILFFSENIGQQFISNLKQITNLFFFQRGDNLPWNVISDYGIMYLCILPFLLAGIGFSTYLLFKYTRRSQDAEINRKIDYAYILIAGFLAAFFAGIITNNVNINRSNSIYYFAILFAGIGVFYVCKRINYVAIPVIVAFAILMTGFTGNYFTEHSKVLAQCFYDGLGQSFDSVKDLNYDKMYVTANTQAKGYWNVSEILTLFYLKTDAQYFQGKKTLVGADGKQLLPYSQRYEYVDFDTFKADPNEKAVYIVNNNEISKFNSNDFVVKHFAYFSAAIPKSMLKK